MDVSGQPPSRLAPRRRPPVPVEQEPGWFPESVWTLVRREIFPDPEEQHNRQRNSYCWDISCVSPRVEQMWLFLCCRAKIENCLTVCWGKASSARLLLVHVSYSMPDKERLPETCVSCCFDFNIHEIFLFLLLLLLLLVLYFFIIRFILFTYLLASLLMDSFIFSFLLFLWFLFISPFLLSSADS